MDAALEPAAIGMHRNVVQCIEPDCNYVETDKCYEPLHQPTARPYPP
eukprot:COSAG03_NODE_181_length_10999_cov_2.623394_8_plen_47_part_00